MAAFVVVKAAVVLEHSNREIAVANKAESQQPVSHLAMTSSSQPAINYDCLRYRHSSAVLHREKRNTAAAAGLPTVVITVESTGLKRPRAAHRSQSGPAMKQQGHAETSAWSTLWVASMMVATEISVSTAPGSLCGMPNSEASGTMTTPTSCTAHTVKERTSLPVGEAILNQSLHVNLAESHPTLLALSRSHGSRNA